MHCATSWALWTALLTWAVLTALVYAFYAGDAAGMRRLRRAILFALRAVLLKGADAPDVVHALELEHAGSASQRGEDEVVVLSDAEIIC